MAWIETIEESEAKELLSEVYTSLQNNRGKISNIMKVQSLNPAAMKSHMDLYMAIMFGRSGLSREEREMIATFVSVLNNCDYCMSHHGEALNKYWKDMNRVNAFMESGSDSSLSQREIAILHHADKLTKTPEFVIESDIKTLRIAGLSDRDILDMALIVGYFNFVNRLALGLGVEFNQEEIQGYKV